MEDDEALLATMTEGVTRNTRRWRTKRGIVFLVLSKEGSVRAPEASRAAVNKKSRPAKRSRNAEGIHPRFVRDLRVFRVQTSVVEASPSGSSKPSIHINCINIQFTIDAAAEITNFQ